MQSSIANLKDIDIPFKVLFTGYLCAVGIGYFFALVQVLFTHGMADGKFGLSVNDIVYSYYGNRSGSVLETKLNGSMKDNASEQQRFNIMQWVRDGADIKDYKADGIKKIIDERCVMCHNKDSSTIPDFEDFEQLRVLTEEDEGETFGSLTRVSHIHLFGISFIFMFVGIIFSFAETPTNLVKCIAIGMPYAFLVTDIISWWLTKFHPMFALLVIIAGMGMAISFMFMLVTSMLEMWFYKATFVSSGQNDNYRKKRAAFFAKVVTSINNEKNRKVVKDVFEGSKRLIIFVIKQLVKHGRDLVSKLSDRVKNFKG